MQIMPSRKSDYCATIITFIQVATRQIDIDNASKNDQNQFIFDRECNQFFDKTFW